MLRLYFVRHGQTHWNVAKRIQGHQDSSLTLKGIRDAELLGKSLESIEWSAVYSSPSPRARKTTDIIISKLPRLIQTDKRLMEMHMGSLEGMTMEEIKAQHAEQYHHYWNYPNQFQNETGEGFEDVKSRVTDFINDLLMKYKSGNILIVTHGIVVKVVQLIFNQVDINQLWKTAFIKGTSVTKVRIEREHVEIEFAGDLTHLT